MHIYGTQHKCAVYIILVKNKKKYKKGSRVPTLPYSTYGVWFAVTTVAECRAARVAEVI